MVDIAKKDTSNNKFLDMSTKRTTDMGQNVCQPHPGFDQTGPIYELSPMTEFLSGLLGNVREFLDVVM